jgi:hypothetical protein
MHYIIGTSFSVKPDPRRGFRSLENQFNVNIVYRLTNIAAKKDNTLAYTFDGIDRSRVILDFEASKYADEFIAKLRNEAIPDYSKNVGKIDV